MVAAPSRRLGCLVRHLGQYTPRPHCTTPTTRNTLEPYSTNHLGRSSQLVEPAPAAGCSTPADGAEHNDTAAPPALDSVQKQHLLEFVSRGVTIVGPEEHGLPTAIHEQVWENLKAGKGGDGIGTRMPEMVSVLNSPGLIRALNAIMGEDWAIVPFIHSGFGGAGPNDQTWHKDDNAHYNARKMRHHRPVQLEIFYYPDEVTLDNGPTCVVPYSHYWTTNHEDSSDNFSGPDHLFTRGGTRDGERPQKDPDDLVERDQLINGAISDLGWPLVKQHKVVVPAGSAVLCSHNIYHRASRRHLPDADRPRFMWRTWIYRTTEPRATADFSDKDKDSFWTGLDSLTGVERTQEATQDSIPVWDSMLSYSANLPPHILPMPPDGVQRLVDGLIAPGVAAEPTRIASAYMLAALPNTDEAAAALADALSNDRENVRRAATYGMAAMGAAGKGEALALTLCELTTSSSKSVRKHAAFALGESAPLTVGVVAALNALLEYEPSVYVRTNSAGALGLIGIRHLGQQATGRPAGAGSQLLPMVFRALVGCLGREENRLDQTIRQQRGLKQCIVDDFSDLCEGGGVRGREDGDASHQRLKPVRSGVRENALWSLVMLCTHAATASAAASEHVTECLVDVIETDENACAIGYAMDALHRLGMHLPTADAAFRRAMARTSLYPSDALSRPRGL